MDQSRKASRSSPPLLFFLNRVMKGNILFVVVLCMQLFAFQGFASTFTWTGAADSTWSNASNWSGGTGYPNNATHDVVFDNNTLLDDIFITEDITVNTLTWNEKSNGFGFEMNGFDLTVKGAATFAASSRYSPPKKDGQLIFESDLTIGQSSVLIFYDIAQTGGTFTMGTLSKVTLKAPPTKVDISLNHIDLAESARLFFTNNRDASFVDFTVDKFCIIEFPKNKTTTISGTVNWDQIDCTTYNIFRSITPGKRADLKFTGGPASANFNMFEDIEIITSDGGNTFTANNHTDLGNNVNISGTSAAGVSCSFDGNGDNTGNWSDASEWSCGCAPKPLDDLTIDAGKTVDLDLFYGQCNDLTFGSATSRISAGTSYRLEIHGDLITEAEDNLSSFLGTTEFRNDVTADTETLECTSCDTVKFFGPVIFEFPNNSWQANDHLKIDEPTIKGRGDLTLDEGTLDLNGNDLDVENDFKINSTGTLTMGTGSFTLIGDENSSVAINGSGDFYNLIIDKASTSDKVTLQTNVLVTNNLDLSNIGIIQMADSTQDTLILADGATVTGGSNASHVDYFMKKIGNDDFTFPVGDGTYYRPIGVSDMAASSTISDEISGAYFGRNPFDNGMIWNNWDQSINNVSTQEYWELDAVSGTPTPKVVLSWNAPAPSGTVTDINDLTVAHWTGSNFEDLGTGTLTGNTTSGTVTSSSNTSSFSPFAVASSSSGNTLPLTLVDFSARCTEQHVLLDWVTQTEINVDYFEVQRSANGQDFEALGMVEAEGNSRQRLTYNTIDNNPLMDENNYRLKMVDLDGTYTYSAIEQVHFGRDQQQLSVFPNPAQAGTTISFSESPYSREIQLTDAAGRTLHVWSLERNQLDLSLPADLEPGLYYLHGNRNGRPWASRLQVQ